MNTNILTNFHRCNSESLLMGCIAAWYGTCWKALQRVVETAHHTTTNSLPSIQDKHGAYERRPA